MVIKTKEIFNGEANAVSYTIHKEEIGRIGRKWQIASTLTKF